MTVARSCSRSALVTDALGEGASPLAGDVHEARIAGDLVAASASNVCCSKCLVVRSHRR
jgi:hypothetical protein